MVKASAALRKRNYPTWREPAYLPTQGSSDYSRLGSQMFDPEYLALSREAIAEDQREIDKRRASLGPDRRGQWKR